MKKIKFHFSIVILFVFFVFNIVPQILGKNAARITTTKSYVTLRILLQDSTWIRATQLSGQRIIVEKDGVTFVFLPRLIANGVCATDLEVFSKQEALPLTNSIFSQKPTMRYSNLTEFSNVGLPFSVGMEVTNRNMTNLNNRHTDFVATEECCVTCKGVKACACAVQASCGSCCLGDCC